MSRDVLRAILHGNNEGFIRLRSDHSASDVTEKEGWNYLHRALLNPVMVAPFNMVKSLIDWGVDVNAIDSYGNSPLHYAVRAKASKVVKLLVESGADVNRENIDKITPFREAIRATPLVPEIVSLLIGAGADLDRRSPGGISDREFAARLVLDAPEITKFLGFK